MLAPGTSCSARAPTPGVDLNPRTAEPVVYWQTRIGIPANGKSMAEALPVMMLAAGPAIGRPTDKPVLLDADRAREGQVKLGELKFLDYDSAPATTRESDSGKN